MKYLSQWLNSSGLSSLEVVIVHDESEDQTSLELEVLLGKVPSSRVRIIEGRFGNPGSARNAGLQRVQTQWVTFWDSDDLPDVENFLELVCQANNAGAECAVGSFRVLFENDQSVSKDYLIGANQSDSLNNIAMNPGIWRWAFKTSILRNKSFLPIRMGEDVCFLAEVGVADFEIYQFPKIVYNYHTGVVGQLTSNPVLIKDLITSMKFLIKELSDSSMAMRAFISKLFWRQFFSVIKRGTQKDKVNLFTLLIRSAPELLLKNGAQTIRSLIFVIKNREPFGPAK